MRVSFRRAVWSIAAIPSIKSIDLRTATYQSEARLTYRLNDYIGKSPIINGGKLGLIVIKP